MPSEYFQFQREYPGVPAGQARFGTLRCAHLKGVRFHKLDFKTLTHSVKKGFFRTPGLPARVEAKLSSACVVVALVGVANHFGFGPFTVFPLSHHSEPFTPGDRTCNGGAYTFQIPGALAVQDAASIRCIYAYVQQGATDGQSAYLVKISRDGRSTWEPLEYMGIAQALPTAYKNTYDFSWDAMTFVCGAGGPNDLYEVRLLDHATVISGGETPASCQFDAGGIAPYYGIDYLHLYFHDTRYTVAHTDCIVETTLYADVTASTTAQDIPVASTTGLSVGDYVFIERTGTNEELMRVEAVGAGTIRCVVTMNHPAASFVTLQLGAKHPLQKLAQIINTPGDPVIGRFGPDQSGVISATAAAFSTSVANLQLQFAMPALPAAHYGKLGNIERVQVTSGHVSADSPDPPGSQQIDWSGGSGVSRRFSGGDNDTRYHLTLDFTQPFLDKLNRTVPMNDCRKMYMVFAPRFEITEQELEDGCLLTASVGV